MITSPLTGAAGTVQLPNLRAFYMFSPFPIIVKSTELSNVVLQVTCTTTGRSHSETRYLHDGAVEFDASRIALLLSQDVDEVFTMHPSQDDEACPYSALTLTLTSGTTTLWSSLFFGVYGAMDQLEERGRNERRRLWMNYPQTIQIWRDLSGEFWIESDQDGDRVLNLPTLPGVPVVEMIATRHLSELPKMTAALSDGLVQTMTVSTLFGGRDALTDERTWYDLTLVPDLSPRDSGTFLRWLHRDGSIGYWLFKNGALQTTAAQRSTFTRNLSGNPAEPVKDQYRNSIKADFVEARQMSLGAQCADLAEYEYLCGLATSPVVERLVTVDGQDRWQRVNIVAASYSRNMKFNTPRTQSFDVTIELPARNTVTL